MPEFRGADGQEDPNPEMVDSLHEAYVVELRKLWILGEMSVVRV
jgi:hypothetical protein